MTSKKTTGAEEPQKQSDSAVSTVDLVALIQKQQEIIAMLQQQHMELAAELRAQGRRLETPPDATTAYADLKVPAETEVQPGSSLGDGLAATWRPWRKVDLDSNEDEKFDFVPQYIPGLVHPLVDKDRRFKIFMDVNDLRACLTVGVLNRSISGMFYHAYKNAEDAYLASEEFKGNGPMQTLWSTGGPQGTNTWHYEPEVPNPIIDIDGAYYRTGAEMPLANVPSERPTQ